jgi:hypothetical protein
VLETSLASRVADTLFGPIEDRDRADNLARLLGVVIPAFAVVEAAFALFLGPLVIAVAATEAALGGLVWWRKSTTAAVVLLAVALAASVAALLVAFSMEGAAGGLALAVSLVGVWAGGRAVHCTVAFRRLAP